MDPITLAGLGMGLFGSVGKMFGRGAANKRMESLLQRMPKYQANPLVAQRLGLAQTLLNARMPGAAQAEKNIYQTQANQVAQAERAATDPNQLLLAGAGAAGQAQQAFQGLAGQESADYQRRLANLGQAQEAQVEEQQKEYQDQMNRYQMETQIKAAEQENRQANWGDIAGLGFTGAMLGQQGMFKGLFGKKTPNTAINTPLTSSPYGSMPTPNLDRQNALWGTGGSIYQAPTLGGGSIPTYPSSNFYSQLPNVPTYLNPMTQPYQPTSPSQWWLGR